MLINFGTVKANKTRKDGEYTLAMDNEARVIFSQANDGEVKRFRVDAVYPMFWVFGAPANTFTERMDAARNMEWEVFVTDTRIVFWSPDIETLSGTVKRVPGKATAGYYYYSDMAWVSHGLSAYEQGRKLKDAKEGHTDKTQPKSTGILSLSVVETSENSKPDQLAATVEADEQVLTAIKDEIAARLKKSHVSESSAIQQLENIDLRNPKGKVILNQSLNAAAPIDNWFKEKFSEAFENDEETAADREKAIADYKESYAKHKKYTINQPNLNHFLDRDKYIIEQKEKAQVLKAQSQSFYIRSKKGKILGHVQENRSSGHKAASAALTVLFGSGKQAFALNVDILDAQQQLMVSLEKGSVMTDDSKVSVIAADGSVMGYIDSHHKTGALSGNVKIYNYTILDAENLPIGEISRDTSTYDFKISAFGKEVGTITKIAEGTAKDLITDNYTISIDPDFYDSNNLIKALIVATSLSVIILTQTF